VARLSRLSPLLAAIVVGLFVAAPLPAVGVQGGVQDFSFASYDADYYLSRDAQGHATLRTVETFVAQFPSTDQNRGIIRAIPNDYDGVPLHTSVQSVVDENGAPVHFEATDTGGFTELALGTDDFVHGRTSYVISYTQQNVVRAFADTGDDEFYWDTNGTGFSQPFGSVTARVHVDPSIVGFLTGNNACYQGAQNSAERCEIAQATDAAGEVFTASANNLGPGENLTVVVGFQLGTFVQVPQEESPIDPGSPFFPAQAETPWWGTLGSILVMVLAVLGAVFTIVRRFVGPRDAKGRGWIIPQYTVPKGINLLEAAEVVGRQSSGIPAQLVSFAVRGKLRILDYPVTESGADYTLQLLTADGVDDQERGLLQALFGEDLEAGAVQEIGVTNDALANAIAGVRAKVRPAVLARGFKAKRSSLVGVLAAVGVFLLIFVAVGVLVASAFAGAFSGWGIGSVFVVFVCLFVTIGFAWRPAVLTESGAEQRDYLLGMRDYLQLAEADRFRMLQSPEGAERVAAEGVDVNDKAQVVKLYEKLLPFAVLWGVEREWAKELTVYYESDGTPDWFVTSGTFNAVLFSQALGGLASSVTTSSTPTPTTSSWSGSGGGSFSGGSFGGGFSGGGGGGGGGGGR
jgi:Predicted membrane protein (DUF2207).